MNSSENNLYIWVDWESSGIWLENGSNADYKSFDLPEDLVRRFEFWTRWFSDQKCEYSDEKNNMDRKLFNDYGRTLAIDLKLFVGEEWRVFYGHKTSADIVEILLKRNLYDKTVPVAIAGK
jgi:hypothetical protein